MEGHLDIEERERWRSDGEGKGGAGQKINICEEESENQI